MPPLIITKVMPIPAIPTTATCFSKLTKLERVKKYLLSTDRTMHIATRANSAPISGVSFKPVRGSEAFGCAAVLTLF